MQPIKRTAAAAVVALGFSLALPATAQVPFGPRPIRPLTPADLPPAPPAALYDAIVRDKTMLLALGKALFWDMQVGAADGMACASCHYHAGADTRTANQLNPGMRAVPPDLTFGDPLYHLMGRSVVPGSVPTPAGANVQLVPDDFPFHKLADPANRESAVAYDSNDVVSSNGAFAGGSLTHDDPPDPADPVGLRTRCSTVPAAPFAINVGGALLGTRKVERRNTSPSINTAFNYRNLWDGRASNVFNGVDPFGLSAASDLSARVWVTDGSALTPVFLQLPNMSAASQAVGPLVGGFEMVCQGKVFADIGRRLMQQRALAGQAVAPDDSVFSQTPGLRVMPAAAGGLDANYRELIRAAFQPALWQDNHHYVADRTTGQATKGGGAANGYQLDELNFPMFFGIAVDAYERSLVSDRSAFDAGALLADAQAGRAIFEGKGHCAGCHDGPLFSRAMTFQGDTAFPLLDRMPLADPTPALLDTGFFNIGVRPSTDDLGIGGKDTYGKPLSFSRQFVLAPGTAGVGMDPCRFQVPSGPAPGCVPSAPQAQRVAVDGAFKVPTLRNVALTAPYFHNGGQKSLAEVVAFYNRGGDRRGTASGDTTGTGPLGRPVVAGAAGSGITPVGSNAAPIQPLGLSATEQVQLVAFLRSLTDPRVACHAAPFDHPALTIPNGHLPQDSNGDGGADDKLLTMRAVGAGGYAGCGGTLLEQLNSGELFSSSAAFEALSTR